MKYEAMGSLLDKVINYEMGAMNREEIIDFFQELIDSGLAWELQGMYGRQAKSLLDSGLCHPRIDPPMKLYPDGRIEEK